MMKQLPVNDREACPEGTSQCEVNASTYSDEYMAWVGHCEIHGEFLYYPWKSHDEPHQ